MRHLALRRTVSWLKPILEPIAELEACLTAWFAKVAHFHLFAVQWGLNPIPEHYDHAIDRFYNWEKFRNSQWLERGVYSRLALKGKSVLELCCGDGFNAKYFYSLCSERVLCCDFDPKAIRTAKRKNSALNVNFIQADIRSEMPVGEFDNIIWDAAIEHFTLQETAAILSNIKARLIPGGILSGYTVVELPSGEKHTCHHEYEFKSKQDLLRVLSPYFENVGVFETIYPGRHNLYFWASDATIPFADGWEFECRKVATAMSTPHPTSPPSLSPNSPQRGG